MPRCCSVLLTCTSCLHCSLQVGTNGIGGAYLLRAVRLHWGTTREGAMPGVVAAPVVGPGTHSSLRSWSSC